MAINLTRRTVSALLPPAATAALCLISAPPASAGVSGFDPGLTRAPYLSDLTQTSVQVSWATAAQSQAVVEYGTPGNCTAHSVIATKLGNPITIRTTTEYLNSVLVT